MLAAVLGTGPGFRHPVPIRRRSPPQPGPSLEMNSATFSQRFHAECENLDLLHDTFSRVLDRTGGGNGALPPGIKHGELTALHAIYLSALSGAMRLKVPRPPPPP